MICHTSHIQNFVAKNNSRSPDANNLFHVQILLTLDSALHILKNVDCDGHQFWQVKRNIKTADSLMKATAAIEPNILCQFPAEHFLTIKIVLKGSYTHVGRNISQHLSLKASLLFNYKYMQISSLLFNLSQFIYKETEIISIAYSIQAQTSTCIFAFLLMEQLVHSKLISVRKLEMGSTRNGCSH